MSESTKASPKNDVAVYIDYENLYISLRSTVRKNPDFDVILEKCREWGRVTIARAYSDWSEFARVVTGQMFSSGIDPIYVPTRKFYDAKTRSQATKNAVDIHIAIDIVKDVLLTKNIDTFVLVSGDRDFVPLINVIRAAGKEIYAIGVAGCTSSELAVAVDGMYYYHQLLQTDEDLAKEQHDVYAKLARAVEIARARGYRSTLGVVKPIMREVIAGFDERKVLSPKGVPYAKFQDFVRDAEKNGFVKTTITPGGGALEIWLAGEDPDEVRRKDDERESGRGRSAASGNARRGGRNRAGGEARSSRSRAPEAEDATAPAETEVEGKGEAAEGDDESKPRRRTRRGSRGGRGRRRTAEEEAADRAENGDSEDDQDQTEDRDPGQEQDRDQGRGRGKGRGRGQDQQQDQDAESAGESSEEVAVEEAPKPAPKKPAARRRAPARKPAAAKGAKAAKAAEAAKKERPEAAEAAKKERPEAAEAAKKEHPEAVEAAKKERPEAVEPESSDDDAADEEGILDLPEEAAADLRLILEEFGTRAPSQRRLVARLKKAAGDGELKGEYREGHFLMAVRKGLEEGWLEKVSKGFYSGLKWSGDGASEGATAGA